MTAFGAPFLLVLRFANLWVMERVLCRLGMAGRHLRLLSWSPVCQVPGRGSPFLCYSCFADMRQWGARVYPEKKEKDMAGRGNQVPRCTRVGPASQGGTGRFPLPTSPRPSRETKAALIICHPELAKNLTTRQPASCHHSPFSKLTAPHDEPSVPISCRLNRTSGSPREIPSTDSGQALRKLRMTAFGAPFLLVHPVCKLAGNGKTGLPHSTTLARQPNSL